MKVQKLFFVGACLLGACMSFAQTSSSVTVASAEKIPTALIVQNHVGEDFKGPIASLYSLLTASLSREVFSIMNPNDAFSAGLPESSALRIADSCGLPVLITVSVDDFSQQDFGEIASQLTMTLSVAAKDAATGATLHANTTTATSPKVTPENLKRNRARVHNDLVKSAVRRAATEFLAGAKGVTLPKPVEMFDVTFTCNIPGASIRIDGLARGTPPMTTKVKPGVHTVEVFYPFNLSFKEEMNIRERTAFNVVLTESPEGRELRQQDVLFANTMERMMKVGETDDAVRIIEAKGYGRYLENSFQRIEGMPEIIGAPEVLVY